MHAVIISTLFYFAIIHVKSLSLWSKFADVVMAWQFYLPLMVGKFRDI